MLHQAPPEPGSLAYRSLEYFVAFKLQVARCAEGERTYMTARICALCCVRRLFLPSAIAEKTTTSTSEKPHHRRDCPYLKCSNVPPSPHHPPYSLDMFFPATGPPDRGVLHAPHHSRGLGHEWVLLAALLPSEPSQAAATVHQRLRHDGWNRIQFRVAVCGRPRWQ